MGVGGRTVPAALTVKTATTFVTAEPAACALFPAGKTEHYLRGILCIHIHRL